MVEKDGVLEEVRAFFGAHGLRSPLHHALGYEELADYIAEKCTLEEAISKAQQITRNFAKRQITFFSNQFQNHHLFTTPAEVLSWFFNQSPLPNQK